jgi:hypothetical protein
MNFWPRVAWNHNPPDLSSQVAGMAGVHHHTQILVEMVSCELFVSQVARVIGMSHWHPVPYFNYSGIYDKGKMKASITHLNDIVSSKCKVSLLLLPQTLSKNRSEKRTQQKE